MSVFTKIIKGELPCFKIFEDELTFAFLALDQVTLGHTLVIPKREINHWFDVPEVDYLQMQKNSQKIGRAVQKATGSPRVVTAVIGFEVPHCHLHLIPAWSMGDLNFGKAKRHPEGEMIKIQSEIVKALTTS
ncbi:MAG: HIT family protein [Bdellovibrionaceae bacterium]|nr:HIT family protein [Pseudobdellovibrionaceae bacterium]